MMCPQGSMSQPDDCANRSDTNLLTIKASHASENRTRLDFQQEINTMRTRTSPAPFHDRIDHSLTGTYFNSQRNHAHTHARRRSHLGIPCPEHNRMSSSRRKYGNKSGNVHLKDKPFKCKRCGKGLMTKQNLQNHFKAIHFLEFLQDTKAKTAAASKQMPLPAAPPTTKLERAAKERTP
jgi:hypothetical protein